MRKSAQSVLADHITKDGKKRYCSCWQAGADGCRPEGQRGPDSFQHQNFRSIMTPKSARRRILDDVPVGLRVERGRVRLVGQNSGQNAEIRQLLSSDTHPSCAPMRSYAGCRNRPSTDP